MVYDLQVTELHIRNHTVKSLIPAADCYVYCSIRVFEWIYMNEFSIRVLEPLSASACMMMPAVNLPYD